MDCIPCITRFMPRELKLFKVIVHCTQHRETPHVSFEMYPKWDPYKPGWADWGGWELEKDGDLG